MGPSPLPQAVGILIIDDDEDIRLALEDTFQDWGYPTLQAAHGDAGLELLRQSALPQVVLVDYIMAGDGEQFLRQVLLEPHLVTRHAYILISASANRYSPEIEALRQQLGAPAVSKPFDLDHLLAVVAQAAARIGRL